MSSVSSSDGRGLVLAEIREYHVPDFFESQVELQGGRVLGFLARFASAQAGRLHDCRNSVNPVCLVVAL